MKHPITKLLLAVIISELAGVIGAFFTTPSIQTWYATLVKPQLSPPNWIFAPVWVLLYLLMGIAAFLVWRKGFEHKAVKIALGVFVFQLVLNSLWSILFFGLHNPLWAFVEIIIMWLAIIATMFTFHKVSKAAMYLLVPYILWVSFAAYLNYEIWKLNFLWKLNLFLG